jgi:hypothetical protein
MIRRRLRRLSLVSRGLMRRGKSGHAFVVAIAAHQIRHEATKVPLIRRPSMLVGEDAAHDSSVAWRADITLGG